MPCTKIVGEVGVEVVSELEVSASAICPEGDFPLPCPRYEIINLVFFMARVFGFTNSDTIWVIGGGPADVRCQRRHKLSNAAGDEVGPWTAWTNVHSTFKDDHDNGQLPASFHLLLNNVNQGTYYLAQYRLRDASTVSWEVHPSCGTKAYHVLMATVRDPGAYIDDRPVS